MPPPSSSLGWLSGGVFCLSHLCRGPCSTTSPASLNRVLEGPGSWRGYCPQRWQCPPCGSRRGLLRGGTPEGAARAGAEEGEGWALLVPPLPGSCQMVAAIPQHKAWLASSQRQHPGAGARGRRSASALLGRCMLCGAWASGEGRPERLGEGEPQLSPTFSLPRGWRHAVSSLVSLYFLQLGFVYDAHTLWRGNSSSPCQVFTYLCDVFPSGPKSKLGDVLGSSQDSPN